MLCVTCNLPNLEIGSFLGKPIHQDLLLDWVNDEIVLGWHVRTMSYF